MDRLVTSESITISRTTITEGVMRETTAEVAVVQGIEIIREITLGAKGRLWMREKLFIGTPMGRM